jgi:hypothetical protein
MMHRTQNWNGYMKSLLSRVSLDDAEIPAALI